MRTKPCLSHDDVLTLMKCARAEALKNKWGVVIAVVDDGGHLVGLERLDGTRPNNSEVAIRKARSSAMTHRATRHWAELVGRQPHLVSFPNVHATGGGLPIMYQGDCVGAIGVSGMKEDEDDQVGQAGIDGLLAGLSR